jgi:hypothetical protein
MAIDAESLSLGMYPQFGMSPSLAITFPKLCNAAAKSVSAEFKSLYRPMQKYMRLRKR